MIKVGRINNLTVLKAVPFGVYLDGGDMGEILLPIKAVPPETQIHDRLDVFIYYDSDDKIIATTKTPLAQVGRFACLKVIDVNPVGAFLAWGLDKDLLVPRPEQHRPLEKDKSYLVYLKLDNQGRIIASSKIDYYLDKLPGQYQPADPVELLIAETTALGRKVIINESHWGLIHSSDIFQPLHYGKRIQGFIKTVREDGKIDVALRKLGRDKIHELAEQILHALEKNQGFLALHDKSSAHEIQRAFDESKKSFKSAIGLLYKQGKINIEPDGIRLKSR